MVSFYQHETLPCHWENENMPTKKISTCRNLRRLSLCFSFWDAAFFGRCEWGGKKKKRKHGSICLFSFLCLSAWWCYGKDIVILHNQHLLRHFHTYLGCSSHFFLTLKWFVWVLGEHCNHIDTASRGWSVPVHFQTDLRSFVWVWCRKHWALWVK